jgi:hypothetical protein
MCAAAAIREKVLSDVLESMVTGQVTKGVRGVCR